MRRLILLLPSAIKPPSSIPFLTLRNENERLDQTLKALKYWSKFQNRKDFDFKVVIGDNTGYADVLYQKASRFYGPGNLTVVNVPSPSEEIIVRGKGAAETAAMQFMLENFTFQLGDVVGKMTGRQICSNAIDLFLALESTPRFAAWPRPNLESIDSRFYLADPVYLSEVLKSVFAETDDLEGIFVEELYARFALWNNRNGFELFKYEPAILGQAGTTGTKLSPLSEANMIAKLVKIRKWLRANVSIIQPSYVKLKNKKRLKSL